MGVMSLAEIMDKSIEILRKYIKTILLFTLAYGVIFIGIIIVSIIVMSILAAITARAFLGPVGLGIIFSLWVFLVIAFSVASNIGMIKISSQEFFEESIYVDNALKVTFRNLLKVLGIVALLTILFIPVMAIFSTIVYFLYVNFKGPLFTFGAYGVKQIISIVLFVITILAAIIAILAYVTLFSFSLQAVAIENKGVIKAIKRSYELVKRDYLKIFGCIILFSVTIYAIRISLDSFVALASSIIYLAAKFLNLQGSYSVFIAKVVTDFQWPLSLLSWLVITPIGTIMITLLYFNQRFKREGYDISLNLNKIEKNEERKQVSEIV